ncbi:MAG TPA: hypothetical protein VKG45_02785 [Actinomycetes bacterium]|nr:hypothetical protein [Actinomycetes bacterium]
MIRTISLKAFVIALLAALAGVGAAVATRNTLTQAVSDALPSVPLSMFRTGAGTSTETTLHQLAKAPTKQAPAKAAARPAGSSSAEHATGPDASQRAAVGLCQAAAAKLGDDHGSSWERAVAYRNLLKAANSAGESIVEYCHGVPLPWPSGTRHAQEDSRHRAEVRR